ncbi:anaerobic ribonucleoside-triphosphate reductase activating protein [Desulfobacter latus]|uniref:Anaerobic ribonucleoside-triphosphate reductase activating protein n=1 Tax=Desulfobacter latus TaxID=2292 RepID=A0A850T5L0_9BACT|nr:anaerobic ribonucleoside-triphosphate reductase activating protein [Desulfobacter latus]NWH06381.1 anaerobic ribonucleoside-triphosphate reductase activating protein [Desulfobacter latus]
MYIGGFQKNSLIDFPGTIACVVFTRGCNFICPYCHNPDLVAGTAGPDGDGSAGSDTPDQEDILNFLDKRKGIIEGLVVTGGEPTLQADLTDFIKTVRQMGYKIKLDTNGTAPRILDVLFDQGLVDYVAMDIKTDIDHYPMVMKNPKQLDRVIESISLIIKKSPAYEFRTTCARPFVTPDIMENIGKMIRGAASYVLQPCSRNVDMLDPDFAAVEDHFLSVDDMEALKAAVLPFVENTRIR